MPGSLRRWIPATCIVTVLAACTPSDSPPPDADAAVSSDVYPVLSDIAEDYVRLALELAQHDPVFLAGYAGPDEWRVEAEASPRSLLDIRFTALPLIARLEALDIPETDTLALERRDYLARQLQALTIRAEVLDGREISFDEELRLLYGIEPPEWSETTFQEVLTRVADALPGEGPLGDRILAFRRSLVVPADRVDTVFAAALEEVRRRTTRFLELPAGESVVVERAEGQPAPVVARYVGNRTSRITLASDLTASVDELLELAIRNAYPGLHTLALLREAALVQRRGWIEHSVSTRYSGQAFVVGALSAYGAELLFTEEERRAFERDVLYPLAGLDPALADSHLEMLALFRQLEPATGEAAVRYLGGELTSDEAARWLMTYALMTPEQARRRVAIFDAYRGDVLATSRGRRAVAAYIEANGGTAADPGRRWALFRELAGSTAAPARLPHP